MFNVGSGELILIAVVALLVLGPKRLPELARGLGKFLREFRRQTDEVRGVVEREFYKMDQEMDGPPPPQLTAATDTVASQHEGMESDAPMDHSDPRHPDYGKPDPALEAEDPVISHHTDPTPEPPRSSREQSRDGLDATPAAAAEPVAPTEPELIAPEKKAS